MGIGALTLLNRAVFLDRDGVINLAIVKNGKPYPPATVDELQIAADVAPALFALKSAGFLLIGVTNQPDVARGTARLDAVEAINATLQASLPIDEILVCYHDDGAGCDCRKPLPGLLVQAAFRYHIELRKSYVIGDRWKDIEAGHNGGCTTIWLDCNYAEKDPPRPPAFRTRSLSDAVTWILGHSQNSARPVGEAP